MPLTRAALEDLRSDAFADDLDIDAKMSLWTAAQATAFFESGGMECPLPLTESARTYTPLAPSEPPVPPRSFADFERVHMEVSKGDTYKVLVWLRSYSIHAW